MRRIVTTLVCAGFGLLPLVARAQDSPAVLMEQGHWKRVRAIAEARLKTTPEDPEANFLMGSVFLEWNDTDKALPYAEKAVKLAPKNAEYHWLLAQAVGDQAEKANVFRQIGLARRFRSETETVLTLDPKHIEAHYGMMLYYFKAPGIVGGDKKKAYAEADEVMKIDRAKGYLAQIRLAREEKQTAKLEELYRKTIEANPKEYDGHTGLINIYAEAGNFAEVEKHARELVTSAAGRVGGYNGLAWAFVKQKKWADLDQIIAESEKAVPDNLAPYFTAGLALLRDGQDLPRAERYLRKYLSQEREAGGPSHAGAQWRLGLVLEKEGRKPEAIAAIEAAVRLDPAFEAAKKDLKRLKG